MDLRVVPPGYPVAPDGSVNAACHVAEVGLVATMVSPADAVPPTVTPSIWFDDTVIWGRTLTFG